MKNSVAAKTEKQEQNDERINQENDSLEILADVFVSQFSRSYGNKLWSTNFSDESPDGAREMIENY